MPNFRTHSRGKLQFVKLLIHALAAGQLGVRAGLDNFSVVEHHNQIGVQDGRKPVRNANRGAALHQFVERRLHGALGFGVERAGGFVEDENWSVFQNGAGDGEALALAAGKGNAFLADDGVEARRFLRNELGGVRVLRSGDYFLFLRAKPA